MKVRNNFMLLDSNNKPKKRYKTRPLFELIDFYWEKRDKYIYLIVVTSGDREGIPISVYQVDGPLIEGLEKIEDLLYRYEDPEDEVKTSRTFEVEAIVADTNRKTLQTTIITDPSIYFFTSNIYPFYFKDGVSTSLINMTGRILTTDDLRMYQTITDQNFTSINRISGVFKKSLIEYFYTEGVEGTERHKERTRTQIENITGLLRLLLMTYQIRPENTVTSIAGITGTLRHVLIHYQRYKVEELISRIEGITPSFTTYKFYQNMLLLSTTKEYNPEDTDGGWTYITVSSKGSDKVEEQNSKGIPLKLTTTSVLDFEDGIKDKVKASTIEWKSNIISSNILSDNINLPNRFDFYLDDMQVPLYENITEEELLLALEQNPEIGII